MPSVDQQALAARLGDGVRERPAGGFLRRFGDVVLIALSSAVPTMPFVATGKVGAPQRTFLAAALAKLGQLGLFRVVLIHHPPLPGQASWRRGLRDAKKLHDIVVANGAELILHGHNHEQTIRELETSTGIATIVGVPSASEAVEGRVPAARYNEYLIARAGKGWSCEMIGRAVASAPEHVWEVERRTLKVG